MLETGLALIAINLPAIWGLTSHISIDSVLRSVRSLLSVHSRDPSGSSRHHSGVKNHSYRRKNSNTSSQNVELVPQVGLSQLNTAVTRNVESPYKEEYGKARSDLEGGINVQWSMQQTEINLERVGNR